MGTIKLLAQEIEKGLREIHNAVRITIIRKLALIVATVMQARTANTAMWAAILPIDTARVDMRMQWI